MGVGEDNVSIKSWAAEDRPREKLIEKGRSVLTNAELIAILIGTGSRTETAVNLSKRILVQVDNDLNKLGELSIKNLIQFKGIGEAKAVSIVAALELGRRRKDAEHTEKPKITCSRDAYIAINRHMVDLDHEQFWIMLLNKSNSIISFKQISKGGVSSTIVDAKLIFKAALEVLASGIILCHNHPSGNLKPSQADIDITKKLIAASKNLDIKIQDHLIVSNQGYLSMIDEGYI